MLNVVCVCSCTWNSVQFLALGSILECTVYLVLAYSNTLLQLSVVSYMYLRTQLYVLALSVFVVAVSNLYSSLYSHVLCY